MRRTREGYVGTRAQLNMAAEAKLAHGKALKEIVRKEKARLRKKGVAMDNLKNDGPPVSARGR
jgi:hypothetical protein